MAYIGDELDDKADMVFVRLCWDHYPVLALPTGEGGVPNMADPNARSDILVCDYCFDVSLGQLTESHRPRRWS